ncbi:dihydrofolate reductase [Candidatus Woesearchaeota archaeon]|nr:dihydrofolate reductase [Candidatus Woesearchaeota archaeon]
MTDITIIAAMAKNRIIGINNQLPWHIPSEIKHYFKNIEGNITICGRNTYEAFKNPRDNYCDQIVVSTTLKKEGLWIFPTLDYAVEFAELMQEKSGQKIFLTGGSRIYEEGLEKYANKMILSVIDKEFEGDTLFPNFSDDWKLINKKNIEDKINYSICEYKKSL